MENTEKKFTKVDYFTLLKDVVDGATLDAETAMNVKDFLDKEIEQLEKRKVAAKDRAEKKKAESDALTDEIYALLTDEPQTVEDLLAAFEDETVTRNKITSRLGKLVKAGLAEKDTAKIDGNRKMVYIKGDGTPVDVEE